MKRAFNLKGYLIAYILFTSLVLQAQLAPVSDCDVAIMLYGIDSTFHDGRYGVGFNDEVPADNSSWSFISTCLRNGENNSVWFKFAILDSGLLSFEIQPFATSNDDYDFALFRKDSLGCAAIPQGGAAVRCNFAPTNGLSTGLLSGHSSSISDVNGDTFNAPLPVLPGEEYYLLIDNFTHGGQGFYMNFNGTTATFDPNANFLPLRNVIYDTSITEMQFNLADPILESSISNGFTELTLLGPNGSVPLADLSYLTGYFMPDTVVRSGRILKRTQDKAVQDFTISFNQPLEGNANYKLILGTGIDGNSFLIPSGMEMGPDTFEFYVPAYSRGFVDSTTGFANLQQAAFNVYPNPVAGQLTIELSNANEATQVQLFDLGGTMVKQSEWIEGETSSNLDLTDLPNGTYMLLILGKRSNHQQRITVLH